MIVTIKIIKYFLKDKNCFFLSPSPLLRLLLGMFPLGSFPSSLLPRLFLLSFPIATVCLYIIQGFTLLECLPVLLGGPEKAPDLVLAVGVDPEPEVFTLGYSHLLSIDLRDLLYRIEVLDLVDLRLVRVVMDPGQELLHSIKHVRNRLTSDLLALTSCKCQDSFGRRSLDLY